MFTDSDCKNVYLVHKNIDLLQLSRYLNVTLLKFYFEYIFTPFEGKEKKLYLQKYESKKNQLDYNINDFMNDNRFYNKRSIKDSFLVSFVNSQDKPSGINDLNLKYIYSLKTNLPPAVTTQWDQNYPSIMTILIKKIVSGLF